MECCLFEIKPLPDSLVSEFQNGNFVIKRSEKSFSHVDPDEGMESVNATGKNLVELLASLNRHLLS